MPPLDLTAFRAVIEAVDEAVVITSSDLDQPGPRILYVNAAFTHMTGVGDLLKHQDGDVRIHLQQAVEMPVTDADMLRHLHDRPPLHPLDGLNIGANVLERHVLRELIFRKGLPGHLFSLTTTTHLTF
ncbi:PAS domain-containing protein [Microvirga sp. BT688]|nr:PAS domain-containing protein [Microvirga sp.]